MLASSFGCRNMNSYKDCLTAESCVPNPSSSLLTDEFQGEHEMQASSAL